MQGSIAMTHSLVSRRGLSILVVGMATCAWAAGALAEDDQPAPPPAKASTTPPADNDAKYDLRYKLALGDVLRYEVSHRASIQSTIEKTTQAAQTKTDSIKVWKVTDVLPNGDIEFMNVVERVSMVNQLPDRDPVAYDSERDKTPPPGFEDAAKSVGVPLSVIRMTPRGKVVRRVAKLRQLRLEDDSPIVVRLPEEPVEIGATWDEPFNVKIELQGGATKRIQTRRHHKLKGVNGNVATIEVTYQVLSPIDAPQEAQLVERMMSGEVQFNLKTGRVVSQQMSIDKRILGFAGPTSSMQYVMKMDEKLLDAAAKVATKPAVTAEKPTILIPPGAPVPPGTEAQEKSLVVRPVSESSEKPSTPKTTAPRRQTRPSRTSNRRRPKGARGYIR
jgi:hypothetical protein